MKDMLAECEQDIAVITDKLKQLRKQPETATRYIKIMHWELMLNDVQQRAGQIKKYMNSGDTNDG